MWRIAAFSSNTVCSATRSLSVKETTLSPKAAAISSRVLWRVSLQETSAWPSQRYRHSGLYLREIEPRYREEERRTTDEDVIVILFDVGESARTSFGDSNIDNEVASSSQPHNFTPQGHG